MNKYNCSSVTFKETQAGIAMLEHRGTTLVKLNPEATKKVFSLPGNWSSVINSVLNDVGVEHPFDFSARSPDSSCREDEYSGVINQVKVYGRDLLVRPETQWLKSAYEDSIVKHLQTYESSVAASYASQGNFAHLIQTQVGSRGERHVDVSDVNVNLYVASDDMQGGELHVWPHPNEHHPEANIDTVISIPVEDASSTIIINTKDEKSRLTHGVNWVAKGIRAAVNMNYERQENAQRDRSAIDSWDGNHA